MDLEIKPLRIVLTKTHHEIWIAREGQDTLRLVVEEYSSDGCENHSPQTQTREIQLVFSATMAKQLVDGLNEYFAIHFPEETGHES